jgi:hypothetical protein
MTSRASARVLLAACLLAGTILPEGSTRGEDTLVWTANANGGLIALSYGSLDASKPPVLLLSCFNEMDIAVLEIFGAIEGARPGQELSIDISAGDAKSSSKGEASIDDKTGAMFAEASEVEIAPLLEALKAPGPLTVKTALTTRTLPELGRADAAGKFSTDCQVK